jgi:hypothetical protein
MRTNGRKSGEERLGLGTPNEACRINCSLNVSHGLDCLVALVDILLHVRHKVGIWKIRHDDLVGAQNASN